MLNSLGYIGLSVLKDGLKSEPHLSIIDTIGEFDLIGSLALADAFCLCWVCVGEIQLTK